MNRHTFRKCLLTLVIAFLVIIALVFSLVIYAMSSAISDKPLLIGDRSIDNAAIQSLSAKLQPMLPKIMTAKKDSPVETLALNEKEINALIYLSINSKDIYSIFAKPETIREGVSRDYNISFKDGKFIFECSRKLKVSTPFGSFLNMRFVIVPSLKDGRERLDLASAKIGKVSVPVSFVNGLFNEIFAKAQDTDENRQLMKVVTEIKIDGADNLVISFRPEELKQFIQGFMIDKFMKSM